MMTVHHRKCVDTIGMHDPTKQDDLLGQAVALLERLQLATAFADLEEVERISGELVKLHAMAERDASGAAIN